MQKVANCCSNSTINIRKKPHGLPNNTNMINLSEAALQAVSVRFHRAKIILYEVTDLKFIHLLNLFQPT